MVCFLFVCLFCFWSLVTTISPVLCSQIFGKLFKAYSWSFNLYEMTGYTHDREPIFKYLKGIKTHNSILASPFWLAFPPLINHSWRRQACTNYSRSVPFCVLLVTFTVVSKGWLDLCLSFRKMMPTERIPWGHSALPSCSLFINLFMNRYSLQF